jgi:hypothetical protein
MVASVVSHLESSNFLRREAMEKPALQADPKSFKPIEKITD